MHRVQYSNSFLRALRRRFRNDKCLLKLIKYKIGLFQENSGLSTLRDHSLTGRMRGLRSFSITDSIRVIYREDNDRILLLDVGSHDQVYK